MIFLAPCVVCKVAFVFQVLFVQVKSWSLLLSFSLHYTLGTRESSQTDLRLAVLQPRVKPVILEELQRFQCCRPGAKSRVKRRKCSLCIPVVIMGNVRSLDNMMGGTHCEIFVSALLHKDIFLAWYHKTCIYLLYFTFYCVTLRLWYIELFTFFCLTQGHSLDTRTLDAMIRQWLRDFLSHSSRCLRYESQVR